MNLGSGALAGISVGLKLVTQYMLLTIELTHVIHTALEEWSGIHHTDTLPETEKNTKKIPTNDILYCWFYLYHPLDCSLKKYKYKNVLTLRIVLCFLLEILTAEQYNTYKKITYMNVYVCVLGAGALMWFRVQCYPCDFPRTSYNCNLK